MTAVGKAPSASKGIGAVGWGSIAGILGMGASMMGKATGNKDLWQMGGLVSTLAQIPGAFQTPGKTKDDNSDDADTTKYWGHRDAIPGSDFNRNSAINRELSSQGLAGALASGKNKSWGISNILTS
jgi:hypothetical protein